MQFRRQSGLHRWEIRTQTDPALLPVLRSPRPKYYFTDNMVEVETTLNQRVKINFVRQPHGRKLTKRWWLTSVDSWNKKGNPDVVFLC